MRTYSRQAQQRPVKHIILHYPAVDNLFVRILPLPWGSDDLPLRQAVGCRAAFQVSALRRWTGAYRWYRVPVRIKNKKSSLPKQGAS